MSFSTIKEPCKEGYRLKSPLKIVKSLKISARSAEYLCKVTIAARSPFGRPPARRVGWAFPVRRRRGVCRRGVYRAAVGCTVPPWGCTVPPWGVPCRRGGVPCRRGVCPARAPGWKEHQRRSPHSPFVGLDRCFRCLPSSRAEVERAPAQSAPFPLVGLDGARKVRPAHQLFSAPSSPTSLRTQLTNFTPDSARQNC